MTVSQSNQPTNSIPNYDLATIRQLLMAAFTAEELRRFCQDRPLFRPIIDRFGLRHGLDDMVDEAIDYCETRQLWQELLAEMQQKHPRQYDRFAPYTLPPGALPHPPEPSGFPTSDLWDLIRNLSGVHRDRYEASDAEQIYRQALLGRMEQTWIEGYMAKSLEGMVPIRLCLDERPNLVDHAWKDRWELADQPGGALSTGKHITEIWAEMGQAGRSLLIVGEAGSGKTITILELARDVLVAARQDPRAPMPVYLTLAAWGETERDLARWVVEQLHVRYDIKPRYSQRWVEEGRLLLLLDGLDEVRAVHRKECAAAINRFRRTYGLTDIVVCSRLGAYEALDIRLRLARAILVQLLTSQQVQDCLVEGGSQLAGLLALLQQDTTLQKLAQTPLMPSVMQRAHQDLPIEEPGTDRSSSMETRRRHLFDTYVHRMFRRREVEHEYPCRQTVERLIWLAQQMSQHNPSLFMIEELQPSWLASRAQRWLYVLSSRFLGGLVIGLAVVLGLRAFDYSGFFWPSLFAAAFTVGLIDGLRFEWRTHHPAVKIVRRRLLWRAVASVAFTGLGAMLVGTLVLWALSAPYPTDRWYLYLSSGLILNALPFGVIFGLRAAGRSFRQDINAVEVLSWSWRGFLLPALFISLLLGVVPLLFTSLTRDPGVHLWTSDGTNVASLRGHAGPGVDTPRFSSDGSRLVTSGRDGTVRLWDGVDGTPIASLRSYAGPSWPLRSARASGFFSQDGARIITAGGDGTVGLWDGTDGNLIAHLEGHTDWVRVARFNQVGTRVVTASYDGTGRLWDGETGMLLAILAGHAGPVHAAGFSRDGTQILTISYDGTARLWDGVDGRSQATLAGHEGPVWAAAFHPVDSRIVTVGDDGTLRWWDGANGTLLMTIKAHTGAIHMTTFSPDGTRLVTTGQDGTAGLWHGVDGRLVATLTGHSGPVSMARFSPDGTRLVTVGRDDAARLWQGEDGSLIAVLQGHTRPLHWAEFDPDGSRVVTAGGDGTARLWDAVNGAPLATLKHHADVVTYASFSPDGSYLVTTTLHGFDLRALLILGTLVGLILGFIGGLRGEIREGKTRPNQGVWLSVRYMLIIGLVGGLTCSLFLLASLVLMFDAVYMLSIWSFLSLFALFGLLFALWYGGLDVLQHGVLRLMLWIAGYVPPDYARFLDHAAERIFLRQAGTGYAFAHGLLREYFAALDGQQACD